MELCSIERSTALGCNGPVSFNKQRFKHQIVPSLRPTESFLSEPSTDHTPSVPTRRVEGREIINFGIFGDSVVLSIQREI